MYTPLRFQASLAAGGLALMPFVLLQLTFPRAGTRLTVDDLARQGLDAGGVFLLTVMVAATVAHFALTLGAARGLVPWLADGKSLARFVADPRSSSALFSPVISLGMTVNVLLGPVAFLLPSASGAWPSLAASGFAAYAALWLAMAALSAIVGWSWFARPLAAADLNFGWLLDVFAWGMLALAGSGIAGAVDDPGVARLATRFTVASLGIGLVVYAVKGALLLRAQLRTRAPPPDPLKPAFFVVVPINCLFAVATFKIGAQLGGALGVHASAVRSAAVVGLFAIAAAWTVLCAVALRGWFARSLPRPDFYPTQWGLVCVLVGLDVLALYTHAHVFRSPLLVAFAYASTGVAALLYAFLLAKFTGLYSGKPALAASAGGGAS